MTLLLQLAAPHRTIVWTIESEVRKDSTVALVYGCGQQVSALQL